MERASFFLQTKIFFGRTAKLAWREKCWKYILFAVIITGAVVPVIRKDIFDTFDGTKSGFFSLISAAIWIGIFNSIQTVCKEHDVIREECRIGSRVSAYITAHCLWQMVICLVQTIIICGMSFAFMEFNKEGILISNSYVEYFISVFLVIFGSDVMGLMISSLANEASTAMTIMPFVLILQLIMSGVLFELHGWSSKIANITFSKWGMSAFGTIADLNNPKYPLKLSLVFKDVRRLEDIPMFEYTKENLIKAWGMCAALTFIFYLLSIMFLKIKNRD